MEREEEELGSGGLQIRERKKRQEEEGEVLEEHRSVFFDPNHGLWKCRHCDWTYRSSSPCSDDILSHQEYCQVATDFESIAQIESFYDVPTKGSVVIEVASKTEITEAIQLGAHKDKTDGKDDSKVKELGNTQHTSIVQEPNQRLQNGNISNGSHELSGKTSANGTEGLKLLASSITKSKVSTEGPNGASEACKNGSMGTTVAHGIEEQGVAGLEGYDLGRILGEQETHDLYCPNCNSCITRRVILRKRKRTARDGPRDEAAKRQQPEEPPAIAPAEAQVQTQDREVPCVFRCLSCFSFFIPTDGGFNIFRIFGKEETTTEVEIPHPSPSDRTSENCGSWLFSCFQSGDSPEKRNDQVPTKEPLLTSTGTSGLVYPSVSHVGDSPSTGTLGIVHPSVTHVGDSASTGTLGILHPSVTHVGDSSCMGTLGLAQPSVTHVGDSPSIGTSGHVYPSVTHVGDSPSIGTSGVVYPSVTHVVDSPSIGTSEGILPDNGKPVSPKPQEASGITPAPPIASTTPDLHITVDPPDGTSDQRDEWNILKPIVYGGLVESITSLSIVSSAAAGGAKTLNIFILGLANLIGGLPIIFHNLHDLRNAQDVADGSNERAGSYWKQLGRRSKFRLHMAVAVLSYILLGMLPPAIYGFSFRESDDRERKVVAVAAASLLCIGLLAVAKAHVGARRAYVKTLLYYLTVAVSASGLAYAAGVLITRILAHFGLVDEGGAAPPPPPGLFFGMVSSGTAALASH